MNIDRPLTVREGAYGVLGFWAVNSSFEASSLIEAVSAVLAALTVVFVIGRIWPNKESP